MNGVTLTHKLSNTVNVNVVGWQEVMWNVQRSFKEQIQTQM